jgi:hypothetical protein
MGLFVDKNWNMMVTFVFNNFTKPSEEDLELEFSIPH